MDAALPPLVRGMAEIERPSEPSGPPGTRPLLEMAKKSAIDDEQTGEDQRHSSEFERLQPFAKKD